MTANAEAVALLDQLMGVERNALLPPGAALPRTSKRPMGESGAGGMVLPGTKRTKSCYDRDIDPLYCAWGVDVYELFVNTKSDIGPNPNKVEESARTEYVSLSREEMDRLGFEHRLFVKLQELVQHCDRTVHRNHEKLKRELMRQSQKRGGNDYVVDVSEEKVEELVRAECQLEDMKNDLKEALKTLAEVQTKEDSVLEEQRKEQKKKQEEEEKKRKEQEEKEKESEEEKGDGDDKADDNDEAKVDVEVKKEDSDAAVKQEADSKDEAKVEEEEGDVAMVIDRDGVDAIPVKADYVASGDSESTKQKVGTQESGETTTSGTAVIEELGKLTLKKQELLCKIATIVTQIGPIDESIHVMTLKLNFVRSDTTTDKTVCEVSGNFMSARDADERIAAHYAGKQYVGWKLVRDKFQAMIKKHGRHGPPRPQHGGGPSRGGAPLMSHQKYMQQGGSGYGDRDRYRRGGGGDDRRGRGGGSGGGRWERGGGYGGGGGSGYGDRDRYGGGRDSGRYVDRRRGGYGDRDRGGGYRSGEYGRR